MSWNKYIKTVESDTGAISHPLYYQPTEEDGATSPTNRVYRYWTPEELYGAWDNLMEEYPAYITRDIAPYKNYTQQWELRRYILTPEHGYDKTIYIGAGVHGSEYANKMSILRIAQLLCERWRSHPSLEYMRRRVRFVIIPMVNPFGHKNGSLLNGNDTNNTNKGFGVNCNRNYDAFWSQTINSGGGDHNGGYPFSEPETRWVKETVEWIGSENLHYAFDLHDAPSLIHGDYWINYNTFHKVSRRETKKLLLHLAQKNITEKLGRSPNLPHDKDTNTSGVFPLWAGRTKGIPASTIECCYDMQPFTAEFTTLAVEVYINAIITNALCEDHRHPVFASNEEWFDLEWYKASIEHVHVSHLSGYDDSMPYEHYPLNGRIGKWEELTTKYPSYVKSGNLTLTSASGKPVYWYSMSPKTPKKNILIVGGRSEPNRGFEPFSNAMLRFAELMNESHDKDKHLTWLKKNVRFIMVPYIEYSASFLNSWFYFAVDGTPDITKKPVSNVVDLMTHIQTSYGKLDGVIYSTELNPANTEAATTTDVFALSPLDSNDVLDIQSYIDYLNTKKKLNAAKASFYNSGSGEYGSYVYNKQNIPCVRIDTGVDHAMFAEHKDEFDGSTGEPITIVPISEFLNLDWETSRRIIKSTEAPVRLTGLPSELLRIAMIGFFVSFLFILSDDNIFNELLIGWISTLLFNYDHYSFLKPFVEL